jgi:hypothetical protein
MLSQSTSPDAVAACLDAAEAALSAIFELASHKEGNAVEWRSVGFSEPCEQGPTDEDEWDC